MAAAVGAARDKSWGSIRLAPSELAAMAEAIERPVPGVQAIEPAILAAVHQRFADAGVSEAWFLARIYEQLASGQSLVSDFLAPNQATVAAMEELDRGEGIPVSTIDELLSELDAAD